MLKKGFGEKKYPFVKNQMKTMTLKDIFSQLGL